MRIRFPRKYDFMGQRAFIAAVWATDYYSLKWIDGMAAFFVPGSDVLGPMGRELIPFGKETEAKEFLKDHKGRSLLRFADIELDADLLEAARDLAPQLLQQHPEHARRHLARWMAGKSELMNV